MRLTDGQLLALGLLCDHGITAKGERGGNRGPITHGRTHFDGYVAWINYRTAQSLENAKYGRIEGVGEATEFVLKGNRG